MLRDLVDGTKATKENLIAAFKNFQGQSLRDFGFDYADKVFEFASENYGIKEENAKFIAISDSNNESFNNIEEAMNCVFNWADAYLNSDDN